VSYEWTSAPAADVATTARALLGWELRAGPVRLRLTELEAYQGFDDPASHAFRGRTPRTAVMFGPAGVAYVYFVFGMHWCLNIVCGEIGQPSAVLVRAGEVVEGVDVVRDRRQWTGSAHELARGPGRLAVALGIDFRANGTSMVDGTGPLTLFPPAEVVDPALVRAGPRVGVASAAEREWRFYLAGEKSVSAYRRHVPRNRPQSRRS
jgi:DNA-3-methyladenine glycosylase